MHDSGSLIAGQPLQYAAKNLQQFEACRGCTNSCEKARFYIREPRTGR